MGWTWSEIGPGAWIAPVGSPMPGQRLRARLLAVARDVAGRGLGELEVGLLEELGALVDQQARPLGNLPVWVRAPGSAGVIVVPGG